MIVTDLIDQDLIDYFFTCEGEYFSSFPGTAEEKFAEEKMERCRREMALRFIKLSTDRKQWGLNV